MTEHLELEQTVAQVRARLSTLTPGTTEHHEEHERLTHLMSALTRVREQSTSGG
ncbi:MAG: hypothetical protein NT132_06990 [Microbacterium sp.]|uniref:hypothetical protein n=1 Tax=Microbacterium sp. TaxID=51671 RepID=UPI00260F8B46|nr:hypothetical protein [Microbacterium sp.]MCX6502135.1 hypothetical protein [Microbacterium sp.]